MSDSLPLLVAAFGLAAFTATVILGALVVIRDILRITHQKAGPCGHSYSPSASNTESVSLK